MCQSTVDLRDNDVMPAEDVRYAYHTSIAHHEAFVTFRNFIITNFAWDPGGIFVLPHHDCVIDCL